MAKKPEPKRAPENTERDTRAFPLLFIADAVAAGGASRAIEAQEASGQRSFVGSDTLPTQISASDKAILIKAGVKFLDPVAGDPLFQYVELPAGWIKQVTDHAMWTHLLDAKGRKRASIFYKAAFYDRSAHLNLNRRYRVECDYDREKSEGITIVRVMDGEALLHETKPIKLPSRDGENLYKTRGRAMGQAVTWLKQHFPHYEDPGAYWD